MKLPVKNNPLDEIIAAVLQKYHSGESIVVQIRQKYQREDEWEESTELLLNDGDYYEPKYVWEVDWWEGQEYVELIAAAPVSMITLDDKWKVDDNKL